MESFYNVKRLALVLALQSEIEGMKAENENRKQNEYAMAYTSEHFQDMAEQLRILAHLCDEQL